MGDMENVWPLKYFVPHISEILIWNSSGKTEGHQLTQVHLEHSS